MNICLYVGIALLIWVSCDLFTGEVWGLYKVTRKESPAQYWLLMFIWTGLAGLTFFAGYYGF